MTYKEFLNTETNTDVLATFLYNFCTDFYCESIVGICDKPCDKCLDSCYGCIKELLDKEIDTSQLLKKR